MLFCNILVTTDKLYTAELHGLFRALHHLQPFKLKIQYSKKLLLNNWLHVFLVIYRLY